MGKPVSDKAYDKENESVIDKAPDRVIPEVMPDEEIVVSSGNLYAARNRRRTPTVKSNTILSRSLPEVQGYES